MAPDTADIAAAIGLARDRELPLAVRGGDDRMQSKENVMDITGQARDLFRGAERQAAADFGIEMAPRFCRSGSPSARHG